MIRSGKLAPRLAQPTRKAQGGTAISLGGPRPCETWTEREAYEKAVAPGTDYTVQDTIRRSGQAVVTCPGCGRVFYQGQRCEACVKDARARGARVPLPGGTGAKRPLTLRELEARRILRERAKPSGPTTLSSRMRTCWPMRTACSPL